MQKIIDFDFLVGGNAIFTIGNKEKRYTYKITKREDQPFFVYVLTGPNNKTDYTYIGCFIPNSKNEFLKLTDKSRLPKDNVIIKTFEWTANVLSGRSKQWAINNLPDDYFIIHAGKCCACGRQLTTPKSIENGIGPKCAEMRARQKTLF